MKKVTFATVLLQRSDLISYPSLISYPIPAGER